MKDKSKSVKCRDDICAVDMTLSELNELTDLAKNARLQADKEGMGDVATFFAVAKGYCAINILVLPK
jgi:hypothetical protein